MLTEFIFEGKQVRFVGTAEKPEWVAQDICDCLEINNVTKALATLKPTMKGLTSIQTLKGNQVVNTVFESGLYKLIFKSRKKIAQKFQDWIFEEVLPAIRKTGRYVLPGTEKSNHYQYGNKYLPFETEVPWAFRGLGFGYCDWERTFPPEFYDQVYRLWKLQRPPKRNQHPPCMAQITIKLIYDLVFRIAPKLLVKQLKQLRQENYQLKQLELEGDTPKTRQTFSTLLHQYLSEEGRSALKRTIERLIDIMTISRSKWDLYDNLDALNGQLRLDYGNSNP